MTDVALTPKFVLTMRGPSVTTEKPAVRIALILVSVAFLVLFLLLPLAAVFYEALRKGVGIYFTALVEPDALAAIKLTLLVAAIAVPAHVVFGLAASWAVAKFEVPGQSILHNPIRLPFSALA